MLLLLLANALHDATFFATESTVYLIKNLIFPSKCFHNNMPGELLIENC